MPYEPIRLRGGIFNRIFDEGSSTSETSSAQNINVSVAFKSFSQCINMQINLMPLIANTFLSYNPDRLYAAVVNNSDTDIYLILGGEIQAQIGSGIPLKAEGGSFEITQSNLYLGPLTAIAERDCTLGFVECIE